MNSVGKNGTLVHRLICDNLACLEVELDDKKNQVHGKLAEISTDKSKIKIYIVPTEEELMIARDTLELIK